MKRRRSLIWMALALLLALTACAQPAGGEDASKEPASGAANSQPAPGIPDILPLQTPAAPEEPDRELTEEDVRALFEEYEHIITAEQMNSGWLVCYTYGEETEVLYYDWVFPSGERCRLAGYVRPSDELAAVGPGQAIVYRTAPSYMDGWQGMPEIIRLAAVEGEPYALEREERVYLPLESSWIFGRGGEELFSENLLGEEPESYRRYEQLCQVRLGLQGLECAFIPDSSSHERFQSFFPAVTTIPGTRVSFDPDSRQLTVQLCNTTLSSGELTEEIADGSTSFEDYKDYYPCTIPEGSLGADGLWITDAQIRQEGWSTLITMTLADEVVGYRLVEFDMDGWYVPCFRLEFTNWAGYLFPEDKLPG